MSAYALLVSFPYRMNCLYDSFVPNPRPSLYELVDLFKTEQAATEMTLRQLEAGGVLAPTRKAYRTKEK